tara:strand:+ start:153 stop:356 length:204 start_codon:yes stop_codon:yes gene_type:complete
MKVIQVKYNIEIPQEHVDKICKKCQCGRRDVEKDLKQMAEVAGRHRVYEFIQPFNNPKKEGEANGNK